MRRTYERGTKATLSFSGGSHASVNIADSMENASIWTVSGSKEAMEVPKNFKELRKRGVRNIAKYSAANVLFPAFFFPSTFTSTLRHVYRSVWPARGAKPRCAPLLFCYQYRLIKVFHSLSVFFLYTHFGSFCECRISNSVLTKFPEMQPLKPTRKN